MSKTDNISTQKGDYGKNFSWTGKDSDGTARNLTGYTITFKVWNPRTPETLIVEETCTVDDAAAGTYHYTIQDGDFDTVGAYLYDTEATAEGKKESITSGWLTVREGG